MLMDYILEKLTVEHYPSIKPQRCPQLNSSSNQCTRCKDICFKAAINLETEKEHIDKNLCNHCGLCKAVCPTQAIQMKGLGEENMVRSIKDKDHIVFSCSRKSGEGTLKLSCLHALHPELLAALFIMYRDRIFYFNMSPCKNCEVLRNHHLLCHESLTKAENFVKYLGIQAKYEIITDEENIRHLSGKSISRRELFSFFKKESINMGTQVADTVISDADSYFPIREILLKAIQEKPSNLPIDGKVGEESLLGNWKVSPQCNGCKICQSACPNKAWKIDEAEENLNIYYHAGKCYGCRKCESQCPTKAIQGEELLISDINRYSLKKQISLVHCSSCNKKFAPMKEEKQCSTCQKKMALRSKIAAI